MDPMIIKVSICVICLAILFVVSWQEIKAISKEEKEILLNVRSY